MKKYIFMGFIALILLIGTGISVSQARNRQLALVSPSMIPITSPEVPLLPPTPIPNSITVPKPVISVNSGIWSEAQILASVKAGFQRNSEIIASDPLNSELFDLNNQKIDLQNELKSMKEDLAIKLNKNVIPSCSIWAKVPKEKLNSPYEDVRSLSEEEKNCYEKEKEISSISSKIVLKQKELKFRENQLRASLKEEVCNSSHIDDVGNIYCQSLFTNLWLKL